MYQQIAFSVKKIAVCVVLANGIVIAALPSNLSASTQTQQPPVSWIDQSTGHRITRLTDQPGARSLYFNYTAFTPDGKQMVYVANANLYLVELATRKSRLLAFGPVRQIVVSENTPVVYFMKVDDQRVYVADITTGELRQVAVLPARAVINTINADGTLIAGTYIDGSGKDLNELTVPSWMRPSITAKMTLRMESKLPMVLFTLDLSTGAVTPILHSTDWLGHVQFSPTDPSLLMYCHEGPWQDVDRIWTIRTDGTKNRLIHKRTQNMEIAGHEFWDTDGKTIWYDLQVPKGKNFFLASYNTETKERRRYQMDFNQWSVHFNGDLDSGIFCGDGGSEFHVAGAPDGQWIELYHPLLNNSRGVKANSAFEPGIMQSEHLVDLSKHDYKLEPNVRFSPDHKYVIFTSNMFGTNYIFAVEVDAAKGYEAIASTKHIFASSVAMAVPDSSATIQVFDHTGTPLANALVLIKSVDTGHQIGVYSTDQNGKIAPLDFDHGMYRISIKCTNGACGDTHKEMFSEQLSGNVVIAAKAHTSSITAQLAITNERKTTVVVEDANHKALSGIQFLVRTADSEQEAWYTTDKSGSTSLSLPADPSMVVIPVKRIPHTYRVASTCSSSSDANSDVIGCVQIGDSTVITLP